MIDPKRKRNWLAAIIILGFLALSMALEITSADRHGANSPDTAGRSAGDPLGRAAP